MCQIIKKEHGGFVQICNCKYGSISCNQIDDNDWNANSYENFS